MSQQPLTVLKTTTQFLNPFSGEKRKIISEHLCVYIWFAQVVLSIAVTLT